MSQPDSNFPFLISNEDMLRMGVTQEQIDQIREWSQRQDDVALSGHCPTCAAQLAERHTNGDVTLYCSKSADHWCVNYSGPAWEKLQETREKLSPSNKE